MIYVHVNDEVLLTYCSVCFHLQAVQCNHGCRAACVAWLLGSGKAAQVDCGADSLTASGTAVGPLEIDGAASTAGADTRVRHGEAADVVL